jgi:hypothetical protein
MADAAWGDGPLQLSPLPLDRSCQIVPRSTER